MSTSLSGRCLCGSIRYEYDGEATSAGYCHCADCRRTTGSAFGMSLHCERGKFRIVAGEPKAFTKLADSGNAITRHFCADCGSPLFTSSPAHVDAVYVEAGSLDKPQLLKPTHQSWTVTALPWSRIDASLPAYPKNRE